MDPWRSARDDERYLTDALTYIPAEDFSKVALTFVETVAAEASGIASDWRALKGQHQSLLEERADPDVAAWRRLEAQLGYDVDEAPDTVMEALDQLAANYGAPAIAEAALAAPGPDAANRLASEIESALGGHHWQCDLARTAQMILVTVRRWRSQRAIVPKRLLSAGGPRSALGASSKR